MEKRKITTYEEAAAYLLEIPRFTTKHTIEDTRNFLRQLGNPDKDMKIIHVAGTNGKGSVCAYMRSILEAAGYSVGVFTSPHLVDIRERFYLKGRLVSRESFLQAFLEIYNRLDTYHPSFFEYLFFMSLLIFREDKPDVCILETGLGGRLDATNCIHTKALAVITRIGLDHTEYLGTTLEEIAGEKAGIMHPDCPAVYWDFQDSVSEVFRRKAEELGIKAYSVSNKCVGLLKIQNKTIDFSICNQYYKFSSLRIKTFAAYQVENASLAVEAIMHLELPGAVTEAHIRKGLEDCFWAGRMEEIGKDIFVDGAHNGDGIRAFLDTIQGDGFHGKRQLLFGVVKDKDYTNMFTGIVSSGMFYKIGITPLDSYRSLTETELEKLKELAPPDTDIHCYQNVGEAIADMCKNQGNDRIYIAGSLYLVGEVKSIFSERPDGDLI